MRNLIQGIHHVTAIASDPQRCLDFYAGVLGLRLLKKTVNFDAPDVYHLYFGDETGKPGTILTFFPYGEIPQGRAGNGMACAVSLSVDAASRAFWEERLSRLGVKPQPVEERFPGEASIQFVDPDGLALRLSFGSLDGREGYGGGSIPQAHSIKGVFAIELLEETLEPTRALLCDHLGHRPVAQHSNIHRFSASEDPGCYVDIVVRPEGTRGRGGKGTVHHLAFATQDRETQGKVRTAISSMANPTPVIDREYFASVYFHEPGGVLFEVATAGPGFAVDEPPDQLGSALKLPPQYEAGRTRIEASLPPLTLKRDRYR